MDPKVWGSHTWHVINVMALTYPEKPDVQDQNNMTAFITSLANVLPCDKCKFHFKKNLEKFPLSQALTSRSNFIKWVIDVHNSVNERIGKRILSYDEGIHEMKDDLFGGHGIYGSNNTRRIAQQLMVMMGVGIGLFYLFRKTKFFKNLNL